jgi:hypothetical protein
MGRAQRTALVFGCPLAVECPPIPASLPFLLAHVPPSTGAAAAGGDGGGAGCMSTCDVQSQVSTGAQIE